MGRVKLSEMLGLWLAEIVLIFVGVRIAINPDLDSAIRFLGVSVCIMGYLVGFAWLEEER